MDAEAPSTTGSSAPQTSLEVLVTEAAAPTAGERPRDLNLSGTLDFMRLLWAVDHALQSTSKRMEQRFGVTGPQRLVIRIVGQFPRASAGEIARILQIHPSTLTGILRRLESRELIERRPDPTDGRRALFQLTKSGKDLDRIVEGTPEAAVGRALTVLADGDIDGARRVLGALTGALDEMLADKTQLRRSA